MSAKQHWRFWRIEEFAPRFNGYQRYLGSHVALVRVAASGTFSLDELDQRISQGLEQVEVCDPFVIVMHGYDGLNKVYLGVSNAAKTSVNRNGKVCERHVQGCAFKRIG